MKKIRQPADKVGIWLDQEKAFIVRIEGEGDPVMEKIKSDPETRARYPGGRKVIARTGQSWIDEKGKKQKRQRYFKAIISRVRDADYIGIFGPGKTREELNHAMTADLGIKNKVVVIMPAGKITKSQIMALVKKYFNSEIFADCKKRVQQDQLRQ